MLQELIEKFNFKGEVDFKTVGNMHSLPITGVLTTEENYSRFFLLNFVKQYVDMWRGDRKVSANGMAYFEFTTPKREVQVYVRLSDGQPIQVEEEKLNEEEVK